MNRISLLNYLIKRYNFTSYLEIGCDTNVCFNAVDCAKKVGVDPSRGGTHRMTSDQFFAQNAEKFDLVFIDGLHWSEQVIRDIMGSLVCLNNGGIIVLHDCNPQTAFAEAYPPVPGYIGDWNGDVWKAIVHFRQIPIVDTIVGDFDHGCGIIRLTPNTDPLPGPIPYPLLDFHLHLIHNRAKLLRLVPWEIVIAWLNLTDQFVKKEEKKE